MTSRRDRLTRIPIVGGMLKWVSDSASQAHFPGSSQYWERRYARGGTSGPGSYGKMAMFKAEVLNDLVAQHQISSVIEFGCGDGNQLKLAHYPRYVGLDVSKTAIITCKRIFADDETKSFFFYDPDAFVDRGSVFTADAAISIDVIFHLVEDSVFTTYMAHLFASAGRFVIVYASDEDRATASRHERHRKFTTWISQHANGWRLADEIPNRYPSWNDAQGSVSNFYVYSRT